MDVYFKMNIVVFRKAFLFFIVAEVEKCLTVHCIRLLSFLHPNKIKTMNHPSLLP